MYKVGIGFDFHKFVEGRPLILGGVKIDYPKGLLGHSDGDVLLHAICDAILGANNKGDIGMHFPDTDPKYKNISSIILLQEVMKLTRCKIINIDTIIICEEPKIMHYEKLMKKVISDAINLDENNISIKAKTGEGTNILCSKEGISAYTITLIDI